jgi:hypothetical protein
MGKLLFKGGPLDAQMHEVPQEHLFHYVHYALHAQTPNRIEEVDFPTRMKHLYEFDPESGQMLYHGVLKAAR